MPIDENGNFYSSNEKVREIQKRWENNEPDPSSVLNGDEAVQMGILRPETEEPQAEQLPDNYGEGEAEDRYQKLSVGGTIKDIGLSVASEASHAVTPKQWEWNYENHTHWGQFFKLTTRSLLGIAGVVASFAIPAAGAARAAQAGIAVSKMTKIAKGANILKNIATTGTKSGKLLQYGAEAGWWAKRGIDTLNIARGMAIADILHQPLTYRWEDDEGHLTDMIFPEKECLDWLHTKETDSGYKRRLMSMVDSAVGSLGVGVVLGYGGGAVAAGVKATGIKCPEAVKTLTTRLFDGFHKFWNAKTEKEASKHLTSLLQTQENIKAVDKTNSLIEAVENLIKEADETGEEVSKLIIDRFHPSDVSDAREAAELLMRGDNIYVYNDGTFSIRVSNWEDAYKVNPEQYKEQMLGNDEINGGITHMNEAVRHTWINRGWIGENEQLTSKNASKIVKNYTDKWELDNNVKVEVVDGLTVKGQKVDGNTQATRYKGKSVKSKKNAIDKKKLQITKLKDKITQLEGGNGEVSDPLTNLKEELRIAENELKELEKEALKTDRIPDITIKIDKNAKDPFATLRSELEHARDIANGTVPNQKKQHFSRYKGLNEAEMSPYYTHKKATGRAKAVELEQYKPIAKEELDNYNISSHRDDEFGIENPDIIEADYEPYTMHSITDKDGKNLAHVKITSDNYIDWSQNHGIERGATRKLIAKLLYENKYPTLIWEAISNKSVESYEIFCKEFPDLVDRIQFVDKFNKPIDINNYVNYTQEKGVLNAGSQSNNTVSKRGELFSGNGSSDNRQAVSGTGENQRGNGNNQSGVLDKSGTAADERGGITDTDNEKGLRPDERQSAQTDNTPTQLKLDYTTDSNPVETLCKGIASGDVKIENANDLETVIDQIVQYDVDLKGKTFKDYANAADGFFKLFMEKDPVKVAAQLGNCTAKQLDIYGCQQLAAVKLLSVLKDVYETAGLREQSRIQVLVQGIEAYVKEMGSKFGLHLNYQKVVNQALDYFGNTRFSVLESQGISFIADILDQVSLNFTRNTDLQSFKTEIMSLFKEQVKDPEVYDSIMSNRGLRNKFTEAVEEMYRGFKEGKRIDPETMLREMFMAEENKDLHFMAKLAGNTIEFFRILAWRSPQLAVNGMLGITSVFKGLSSALTQGVILPAEKIMGGILTGNPSVSREALDSVIASYSSIWDCMKLGAKAFYKGQGAFVNTKEITEGEINEVYQSLDKLFTDGNWGKNLADFIIGLCPRLMMMTDDMMSQIYYRGAMKAKCLAQARAELKMGAKIEDIAKRADELFARQAFDEKGVPLDMELYEQARDILFQLPLNGQLYNPKTGMTQPMRTQQLRYPEIRLDFTAIPQGIQMITQKLPFLKHIVPFIRTPFNIADQVLRKMPVLNFIHPETQRKLGVTHWLNPNSSAPKPTPEEKAQAFGGFAVLGLLGTGASIMASSGNLTGSAPIDRKEKTALYKAGWRPYSIKIGGKWYSYMGLLPPYDSLLALVADWTAATSKRREEDLAWNEGWDELGARIFGSLINNIFDQTNFRTNGAKLLDIINPELDTRKREELYASILGNMLPLSGTVKAINRTRDEYRQQEDLEGFYPNLVKNYTHLFVEPQDYKRDVFGNRVDVQGIIITNRTDDLSSMPEYAEMQRLAHKGFTPQNIGNIIGKAKLNLKEFKSKENGRSALDAMYEELSGTTLNGKSLQQAVRELVTSDVYQACPDGTEKGVTVGLTKTELLKNLYSRYYVEAKRRVIFDRRDEFTDEQGRTIDEANKAECLQAIKNYSEHVLNNNITNRIREF